jgi:small subunit ribosomal protein S15
MPTKQTKPVTKKTTPPVGGRAAAKKEAVVKKTEKAVKTAKPIAVEKIAKEAKVKKVAAKPVHQPSELVKKYRNSAEDTGSVAVQISRLTERIQDLSKHLGKHIHDFDSKRGLLILVGKRRRLLSYMRERDEKNYLKLIQDLKLKK